MAAKAAKYHEENEVLHMIIASGNLNFTERKKVCAFCQKSIGRLRRFIAHGRISVFWVCRDCLKVSSPQQIQATLENFPLPKSAVRGLNKTLQAVSAP